MDRRSPAPSCGDLRQADETKAHHAGFVIGASISAYCPDQAPPRSVNVRTTASRPRRLMRPHRMQLVEHRGQHLRSGCWLETALGLSRTRAIASACLGWLRPRRDQDQLACCTRVCSCVRWFWRRAVPMVAIRASGVCCTARVWLVGAPWHWSRLGRMLCSPSWPCHA